jgi:PAS domain S-box-containing protein
MGDVRFKRVLETIREDIDPATLRATSTEDLVMALAAANPEREPLLANILATEVLNRTRRTSAIAEHLVEGVLLVESEGIITYANPSAERLVGMTSADLVGRRIDVVKLQDQEGRLVPWEERPTRRALAEGRVTPPTEMWILRPDEARVPISFVTAPIPTPDGVVGAVMSFRETTQERKVASEIRFHKTLLDAVGEAVVATSPDGSIIYWNRSAEKLFGWPAEQALGRNVLAVAPDERAVAEGEAIMERLRRGETWSGVFNLRDRHGGTFPAHVTNAPVRDERGELVAIIGVSRPLGDPTPVTPK